MDYLSSSLVVIFISCICILLLTWARKPSRLPPAPYGAPIIGNILQLGRNPHLAVAKLARKYGPVMSLKLGSVTTVVFSTPEAAKMVFHHHESSFTSRALYSASKALRHHESSMVCLPAGKQWRKLRKICKEQMFSASRLDGCQGLRREKLQKLHDYVAECSEAGRAVDLGDAAFTTNFADYFPLLEFVDPQGIFKRTKFCFGRLFFLFGEIIEEKLKSRGEKDDLVEALIDLSQSDEAELSIDDIKHLLLDLFIAGTDTTSGTVLWAMAELIRNPSKMFRLRTEIRDFIRENGEVQESDIKSLLYLQAVVKEIFRLHPIAHFLIPRKADSDVEINGYIVPKDAQILVNVRASGRDPSVWENADEFMPERFLNENNIVDFRGQDFELIPFGAGRRICPRLPLANRMVHQMLVIFVGNFEWKLKKLKPEELDMSEKFGLSLHKAMPLRAIPMTL